MIFKMEFSHQKSILESNFETSYLSDFSRYGLREKCVKKLWSYTFTKTTLLVRQNILRASSKGIVLKLHFL